MHYRHILIIIAVLALLTGCTGNSPAPVALVDPHAIATPASDLAVSPNPAKKVYLTFDDGPNSIWTGQVLDILKRYGVKATFCVVGTNVEKNPDVLKRIVAEGHSVVNHSYSHDYKKLYNSPEAFLVSTALEN